MNTPVCVAGAVEIDGVDGEPGDGDEAFTLAQETSVGAGTDEHRAAPQAGLEHAGGPGRIVDPREQRGLASIAAPPVGAGEQQLHSLSGDFMDQRPRVGDQRDRRVQSGQEVEQGGAVAVVEQAVSGDVHQVACAGPEFNQVGGVSVASAPGLVTKVRSPSASTRQTTKPVSGCGRGASRMSMPSAFSAARARSPKGPVPCAPA